MKICTKCKKEKELYNFIKYHKSKDGLEYYCKTCRGELQRKWRLKNRSAIAKYNKEYNKNHQKEKAEKAKEYGLKNRKKISAYNRKWREKNKERANNYSKKYQKEKRMKDPKQKLNNSMSRSIRHSLDKGMKNNKHWKLLVGYSRKELVQHLEKLFQPGMTWDNYGEWHIDHIKPVSSFTVEQFKECWALDNLQPLWARDNLSKGAKILA